MEKPIIFYVAQAVGFAGIVVSIISFQFKDHKKLMILRAANELLLGIQYLLLGAYTGMAMNFIGVIRDVVFADMVKKGKSTIKARALFSGIFAISGLFTYDGFKTIFSSGAKVISTCLYGSSNTSVVRFGVLFTNLSWLVYDFAVESYAGCLSDIVTIISVVVAIIRLDLKKKSKKADNKISEITENEKAI